MEKPVEITLVHTYREKINGGHEKCCQQRVFGVVLFETKADEQYNQNSNNDGRPTIKVEREAQKPIVLADPV